MFNVMNILLKWKIMIKNVIKFVKIVEIINWKSFIYNAN
jgi:hypothetical protein